MQRPRRAPGPVSVSDLVQLKSATYDKESGEMNLGKKLAQTVEGFQSQVRRLNVILQVPDRGKNLTIVSVKAEHRLQVKFPQLCHY